MFSFFGGLKNFPFTAKQEGDFLNPQKKKENIRLCHRKSENERGLVRIAENRLGRGNIGFAYVDLAINATNGGAAVRRPLAASNRSRRHPSECSGVVLASFCKSHDRLFSRSWAALAASHRTAQRIPFFLAGLLRLFARGMTKRLAPLARSSSPLQETPQRNVAFRRNRADGAEYHSPPQEVLV